MSLAPWLLAAAAGTASFTTPHLVATPPPHTVHFGGRTYIDHGLVAAGSVPAGTLDFMGDTLGSFSSLGVQAGQWRRTQGGYQGLLWTLPDRGRNDPDAGLFYDYAARLARFRMTLRLPGAGQGPGNTLALVPDGGLTLRDFEGQPFTGADPGAHTVVQGGVTLPSPASGPGAGKISLDAESLQFTADGHFYLGDEYTANVYYFDPAGRLRGVIEPPPAIVPRNGGLPAFGSLQAPQRGRRNNQGIEGLGLSPDGTRLFVALQSALVQDTAEGKHAGRRDTRVLVYDVGRQPLPKRPIGHYVVQLPVYARKADGTPADSTAAQSELRVLDDTRFLLLARDGAGLGADKPEPMVYKSILLVDTTGASNLAGSRYERGDASVLASPASTALKPGIKPMRWTELVNLLDPDLLAQVGLDLDVAAGPHPGLMSEKWESMALLPALDPARPDDWLLLVGNDNDFIARRCVMQGHGCDSAFDNDSRVLVYRLTLPKPVTPRAKR
ncbi:MULTISPECIES: esterase-like activity of phytase family protein [Pseudoxanthomonas]|uniref:Esterase-like activity of phytase family protein n=1 Tax=Pseudoxanthomonas winnipegensis TaxID=2480810 RepID=A0A4Q8LEE4_9GAMM|nr:MULTISPECIES: esterase-like activity of phytase family protein [Pseudoxanthomonas]TAA26960.1 esterase-like activity of phytase family protein [Pseudoxanthomonas winnipegensis]TMN24002.1 esterase-like activity of phytase family protein [Pseudoxanthomonas sp. X-1]UAY75608.1 esterase-like activity of phytase family protein [Pseudoxanthomonas sp. X-1]